MLKNKTSMSLLDISNEVGRKEHTNARHSYYVVKGLLETGDPMATSIYNYINL
jgi:chromosomal replication initiation ATPase DnaA